MPVCEKRGKMNLVKIVRNNMQVFRFSCPSCRTNMFHDDDDWLHCGGKYCYGKQQYLLKEYLLQYFIHDKKNIDVLGSLEKSRKPRHRPI